MQAITAVLALLLCLVCECNAQSLFDFSTKDLEGKIVSLRTYESAKAILVVNVASQCGYTRGHYKELKDMYNRLKPKGLEILAFPCNQFGNQEPGDSEEIGSVAVAHGLTFPFFEKINVNGPRADPIYKFLKRATDRLEIPWNFHKYLVINGKPVKKYNSETSPKAFEAEIIGYLERSDISESVESAVSSGSDDVVMVEPDL